MRDKMPVDDSFKLSLLGIHFLQRLLFAESMYLHVCVPVPHYLGSLVAT